MSRASRNNEVQELPLRAAVPFFRDAAIAVACLWLALIIRFDGRVPPALLGRLVWLSPLVVLLLLLSAALRGTYGSVPRYASLGELLRLGEAVGLTTIGLIALVKLARPGVHLLPLSVPVIWALIVYPALGAVRLSHRLVGYVRLGRASGADASRVLIVGAGDAGEMIVRDMLRRPLCEFLPVGFVDDDPSTQRRRIHGVPVVGRLSQLEDAVRRTRADLIVIAMPSASSEAVRGVLESVARTGVKAKIVPSLEELMGDRVTSADIRDVDVEDLIGRQPVKIDVSVIAGYLSGRDVLITGAAGSIGSELARQALRFGPSGLLLLDNNESDLFCLCEELGSSRRTAGRIEMIVADVRNRHRIDEVFTMYRPQVVFHAAAYKHVPVMEHCPGEAVATNVTGTRNVAEAAVAGGTERFVLVSTDKAVRPLSVMGATKRLAEMLVTELGRASGTVFCSVRFGNVLGSRGSVVPIFVRQIRQGGPITVSHPEAARYFMTVEEAAALIVQAGALAKRGETFILDMGEQVRILDLAERMRQLLGDGHKERIEITFTGLRPGEKLHEELRQPEESLVDSQHPRILLSRPADAPEHNLFRDGLLGLEEMVRSNGDGGHIREELFRLVGEEASGRLVEQASGRLVEQVPHPPA